MPRPDATAAFVTAIQNTTVRPALFVRIDFTTGPVYVWSGFGNIVWNGLNWSGVGDLGSVSSIEEGSDVQARGITLTLSGFDSTLLTDALTHYRQGLPAIVYLGLFDSSNALIANPICCWSGRTDQPTINVSGDKAEISIACENRLVEMNVGCEFRYNDQTQKLFHPGDRGMEWVSTIQNITIYWGRMPSKSVNVGIQGS